MEQPQGVREHEINDGERVFALRCVASVRAAKNAALLASTYQSQYSLQKKR